MAEKKFEGKKFTIVTRKAKPDEFTAKMIEKIKRGEKTAFLRPARMNPIMNKSDLREAEKEFPSGMPDCFNEVANEVLHDEISLPVLCVEYSKEWTNKYCTYCRFWAGV